MRRMVKEELLTFEGKPLFPERRAYTVTYPLSSQEALLYEQVTEYVREEMNRADRLKAEGELVDVVISPARKVLLHRDMVTELEERILSALSKLHEQFPKTF